MATETAPTAKQILAEPGAPVIMFDHVQLAFDEKVVLQRSQLHAAQGPHEDHPRRQRVWQIDRSLKIIIGLLRKRTPAWSG